MLCAVCLCAIHSFSRVTNFVKCCCCSFNVLTLSLLFVFFASFFLLFFLWLSSAKRATSGSVVRILSRSPNKYKHWCHKINHNVDKVNDWLSICDCYSVIVLYMSRVWTITIITSFIRCVFMNAMHISMFTFLLFYLNSLRFLSFILVVLICIRIQCAHWVWLVMMMFVVIASSAAVLLWPPVIRRHLTM